MQTLTFYGNQDRLYVMNEPTIICPNCQHELKLTESLAAPLIQQTRHDFEQRIAQKDREIAERESSVREQDRKSVV